MRKKINFISVFILTSVLINGCTEAYDIKTETIEEALVVEATITNELKFQEIKLSKATTIDNDAVIAETNATIVVKDDAQNTYTFTENTPGIYISNTQFSAQKNTNYQLFITTSGGETYESNPAKTTSNSTIEAVDVKINKGFSGNDEFELSVSSFDPTGQSKYYRYTYEETYKIIAPYWSPYKIILTDPNETIQIVPKTAPKKICYQTQFSKDIIQKETASLTEDRVSEFTVRTIPVTDFIISHRYSILVKQYVQSIEAYTYYKVLNKFSNASDLLSQSQPGFFEGNIKATSNSSKKIIGFFEVASVSSKRIFFNYRDFFTIGRPDTPKPCYLFAPSDVADGDYKPDLYEIIISGNFLFYDYNAGRSDNLPGPYLFAPKECGDCTAYGTETEPSFWTE